MPNIDNLDIKIKASAELANRELGKLSKNIAKLSSSMGTLNTSGIRDLCKDLDLFYKSVNQFKNGGLVSKDFTRIKTNIEKLATINSSGLIRVGRSVTQLSRSFRDFSSWGEASYKITELANSISKLGRKSTASAIDNIPKLSASLNKMFIDLSKMPRIKQSTIDMTNAVANLTDKMARLNARTNKVSKSTRTLGMNMNTTRSSAFSLASAFGKFYASYFLLIRGSKALFRSIKGTADYLEAYNYYAVSTEKVTKEWNASSKELTETLKKLSGVQLQQDKDGTGLLTETGLKNLGLNIKEITQYSSQLVSVTNSVGLLGEVSMDTADTFVRLAGDLSSLFNIDYSQAATNLQSGLIGQSRALYKYGIDITNATLQTYAYAEGITKAVSQMTQAEKMQLRILAILDQSRVSWGDLANTISSPSNMIRQFKNNLSELGNLIGQLFIPMLSKIAPVINGITVALKRLVTSIALILGIKLDLSSFSQGFQGMEDSLDDTADGFDKASSSAKKFKSIVLGIDELNINAPQEPSGSGGGIGGGSIDLSTSLKEAMEEYDKAWEEAYAKMENKVQQVADKIEKAFEPIKELFKDLFEGNFFEAGQDVSGIVIGITDYFTKALKNVEWDKIGKSIGEFLNGIDWVNTLKSVGNFFATLMQSAVDLWVASFKEAPVETAIITAIATVLPKVIPYAPKIAITTAVITVSFDLGKEIGKALFPNDTEWYDNFSWFGDKGFINYVFGEGVVEGLIDIGLGIGELNFDLLHLSELIGLLGGDVDSFTEMLEKFGVNIYPLKKIIISFFSTFKENIDEIKRRVKNLVEYFKSIPNALRGLDIKSALVYAFNSAIEAVKRLWNSFATSLNEKLKFEMSEIRDPFGNVIVEGREVNLGFIPTFDLSTTPPQQKYNGSSKAMYSQYSNTENSIGHNGIIADMIQATNNALANNSRDTDLSNYLSQIAQNTRETADKELVIGDKAIAKANKRGSLRMGYSFN